MEESKKKNIMDIFGINVFNDKNMKKYLSSKSYEELKEVIKNNKTMDLDLANIVAISLKDWALDNGVTHYTHWFQPLSGQTAEKQDAFIAIDKQGEVILEFTGKNLSKGETDASSFPSGGIRETFEARGYTLWDCSSPCFIRNTTAAPVLYIPTAFCSYNGEALDKKTPLLRSMEAINKSSLRLLKLLGIKAERVQSQVGAEQEYFLIDKKHYYRREDLKHCGRTLFGAVPPKCQETSNQYYGIIRNRVGNFMNNLNEELWKLGITAKTQHNEVAPCQHELVPLYSTVNVATDQNQIIMDLMKTLAPKYGFECLLHEKPFRGINGSGKHNNWSLSTDNGLNLLNPTSTPFINFSFLLFITAVISGVDNYQDLIRMSASSVGNDERLGEHEAPPPVVSIFLGDDIEKMFEAIVSGSMKEEVVRKKIATGVSYVAQLQRDSSDRNRTSPFAFTGNKFEFRMLGSSATLANPNMVINTIVSESLNEISDMLEKELKTKKLQDAVYSIVKNLYTKHKRIIYKGNNYSNNWLEIAKNRKLDIITNCVDAYKTLSFKKNIDLFEKHNVMSKKELESRQEIYLDNYLKAITAESRVMQYMVNGDILPSAYNYLKTLLEIDNLDGEKYIKEDILKIKNLIKNLKKLSILLNKTTQEITTLNIDTLAKAERARDEIKPLMEKLRKEVDTLEISMPSELWPMPKYNDILYYED